MDIPRPTALRNKRIRQAIYAVVVIVGAGLLTLGLSRMKPAAPTVERATLWPDKVKRGSMLRDVRGTGTLVPEDSRLIPAVREGLVEEIRVRTGDSVKPDTVLLVLSNPDLQQNLLDAELQIRGAEADLANTRATLQSQILTQETVHANTEAAARRARLQADANQALSKEGLISDLTLQLSRVDAENLAAQAERERARVEIIARSVEAQIASQENRIQQLRATRDLRRNQLDQLRVRAGAFGVIQQLPVEVGQRVSPGAILAKVAEPGRLKAELRIPETQMKDIAIGQIAAIDTRNGIIPGRVSRIDPAATQGTVTVDVQLEGDLPRGARPDLSVDGTVEIERLEDVMYIARPAYGQADSTIQMFKVLSDGDAIRVPVRLGRSSVNAIEILDGLQVGDEVILSDMSAWDAVDRVRLK
jgi:HlyD family secretion protein